MQVASTDCVESHPTPRRSVDAGLFALAGPHNVVTTEALAAAGIGRNAIARRVGDGRLTRLFRGVYRVGPLEAKWTSEAAALLACGADAVLSHGAAAAVWGIRPRLPGAVDVTVTDGHRAGRPGIRIHHSSLDAPEVTRRDDLRLTAPERTLLDLAATIGRDDLDRAANEAQVLGLTTATELHSYLARSSGRRGTTKLHAALRHDAQLSRSEAERTLLSLIRRIGLPRPSTNVNILGHEVDFVWPAHRLIVETDGFGPHGTRRAFERDRRRDAQLQAAGYRVLRFTWWQLANEPEVVAARLAAMLALSGEPGRLRA